MRLKSIFNITPVTAKSGVCTFTFTFMHLADAFIQSDLQLHSGYTFSLVHVFPGNRTHNLLRNRCNALPLSHTGTLACVAFVFKGLPLFSVFSGKGFSEVADWLRVQESLKWALAGFAESWACRIWQTQLSTRTHGKKIN